MKKEEVQVFHLDKHRVIEFDDHQKVKCDVVGNVNRVYSENGSTMIYCPGCGKQLERGEM